MATRDLPRFGDLVRRLRNAAALSQEELAERAGLSVRAISDLERGVHRAPRLETVRLLADALGLEHSERADLIAAARPSPGAALSAGPVGLATLDPLPSHPTRLIDREAEMMAIRDLLAVHDGRLVTLTGAGGTGKTRLALAVAHAMRERFRDGVCLVDLSPLTDPALVVPTIAKALGDREIVGESSLETLGHALRERQLLLVLDNCEQVLDAATDVATLLAACPDVVILATSRVPLRIRAEREVEVTPLPLPDPGRLPPLAELESVAAVALLVERARAARADFALTADNAVDITSICQRLDGLPLAIELAAARVKVLSPGTLLTRLEQRLPLLTGGSRDLPMRQRTMRDAIAWSYDLLSPEEQALFRRLGAFAGGFSLDAAEAVAAPDGDLPVLVGVVALVEQSLLRQMPGVGGEPRYQMLETVREFGRERLVAAEEANETRERHARHFLNLSHSRARGIHILMDLERITRLAPEQDNVRLALAWFADHGEIDALLGLSCHFYGVWLAQGQYREGLAWLERGLDQCNHTPSVERIQALVAAAMLAIVQGDYARAAIFSHEGVVLARALDDPLLAGQALAIAGFLAYHRGAYARAADLLDEGCQYLGHLGECAPAARPDTGFALLILGNIALVQEQFERAAGHHEGALELFQLAGNDWGIGEAQAALGASCYCTGNYGRAVTHYTESLGRSRHLNHLFPLSVVTVLHGLAGVASATGQPETGARLLGAAEGILSAIGAPMYPRDRPVRERALAALTVSLGPRQLSADREAGRALTREAAIAEAQAVAEAVTQS